MPRSMSWRTSGRGGPLASLPLSFAEFAERTGTIIAAEGYGVVGDLCDQTDLPLDEDVRPRILAGKRVSARQYLDALAEMGRIKAQFAAALDAFDVLATPTVGTPAIPLDHVDQTSTPAGFTRAVNLLERCALTVPNGLTGDGLPSGLQLIGRPTMRVQSSGLAGPMSRQRIGTTACHRDQTRGRGAPAQSRCTTGNTSLPTRSICSSTSRWGMAG